jgi:O-antigen/teichoic acid export membrane protein
MVRILLAGAILVIAGVFCILNGYEAYKTAVILALVVFKVFESFADVLYGILQVDNKLYKSGKSLTVKALLGMAVFVAIDITTNNILLGVVGIVAVNALVFLLYDYLQADKVERIRILPQEVPVYLDEARKILKRCFGVFAVMFLAMLSLNIPRYFIDIYSVKEVGYFGIIAMPITLIVLLITFILQPSVVGMSEQYSEKKTAQFKKSVNRILILSVGVGFVVLLGTVLVGVQVLELVFGVDFGAYRTALNVIVFGGIISALVTVYLNVFVIMRRVKFSLIVLTATNLILIPVSYFVVRDFGLMGGVWAFMATNAIQLGAIAIYFNETQRTGGMHEKS